MKNAAAIKIKNTPTRPGAGWRGPRHNCLNRYQPKPMLSATCTLFLTALRRSQARLQACGLAVVVGLSLLGAPQACAVLGGAVTPASPGTSIPAAVQLRSASAAASAPTTATPYTVQSTVLDTGTTVQEYATPAGVVFAVAWQGPVLPRLDALLGSYFAAFTTGVNATRHQRSVGTPLNLKSTPLVVRSSGRMGHFSGHAYAPSLVPGGVVIGDVLP